MPICAIGPQEAHAPVGPNPSWLRLVELEGDRARCAPVPVSNWRKDAIPKQVRGSILIGGILTLKETGSRDRC